MTFSAYPARTTLRDRLRRLNGPQRALFNVLVASAALLAVGALLVFVLVRAVVSEQAAQLGNALAAEAAGRSAEYLVHDDLVSLNVITVDLSKLPGILGVTVYDRNRQPLAQSGLVQATPDTHVASAEIVTQDGELRGTVEIYVDRYGSLPALTRFEYALGGWVAFAIMALVVVGRLQRENLGAPPSPPATVPEPRVAAPGSDNAQAADETIADEAAPAEPSLPAGPLLRIGIANYETLEQRYAPHLLSDLVDLYDEVLGRASAVYQGQLLRPLTNQCLVHFPVVGDTPSDALFRAVCCAQLFFGVVREMNAARRAQGKVTMQFTAALHEDPSLSDEDRAHITWEICHHAGVAGRLTVTDIVSEDPLVGDRLVTDAHSRQLLQIELAGADGGESRRQDVLALGVLRLADPYEDLIARQVQRLSEPATA